MIWKHFVLAGMSLKAKAILALAILYLVLPGFQAPAVSSTSSTSGLYLQDAFGRRSPVVYLDHGIFLTSASAVLGESYLWDIQTQSAPPAAIVPPRQLFSDEVEALLPGYLCSSEPDGLTYSAENRGDNCHTYNLIKHLGVHLPDGQTFSITRPLYIDRVHDIAVLEVNTDRYNLSALKPSVLDASLLESGQQLGLPDESIATVLENSATPRINPHHGQFNGAQQVTPVVAVSLTSQVPANGTPYYSLHGIAGLQWATTSAGPYMSPTKLWYHRLWEANEYLQSHRLQQVLDAAIIPTGVPGRPTVDDPIAPTLGNSGYDVLHYDLGLSIDPTTRQLQGIATLRMKATYHHLAAVSLDLVGMTVDSVQVDGEHVTFTTEPQKLIFKLNTPLDYGEVFAVQITYHGIVEPFDTPFSRSFTVGPEYEVSPPRLAFANQPDGARTWYPVNDHPTDRATYKFQITVPEPYTAVANGILIDTAANDEQKNTFTWEMTSPMASNLSIVAVAEYTVLEDVVSGDVLVWNYVYTDYVEASAAVLSTTAQAFEYLENWFGEYPFATYGHVATPLPDGAIETQTMVMMPTNLHLSNADAFFDLVVHELAHHWYGNTVTLHSWRDIWLNEGFATYAEWLVREATATPEDFLRYLNRQERVGLGSTRQTPLAYPNPVELYSRDSYVKGAWVLHMLRETLGDEVFFGMIRAWATDFARQTVTTTDFFRHAERYSGQNLTQFREQWLYQSYIPNYRLFWSQTGTNLTILACNLQNSTYQFPLVIQLIGAEESTTVGFALENNAQATFQVGFEVERLAADPQNNVLGQFSAQYEPFVESCIALIE